MNPIKTILAAILVGAGAAGAAVLVWDHDRGATFDDPEGKGKVGTEYAVTRALAANGVADVSRVFVLPSDLGGYDAVFVLAGFWPKDGSLTPAHQDALVAYLAAGGKLYMEGTELAGRYGDTVLFGLTGAAFVDDGRTLEEGNVDEAEGIGPWAGFRLEYFSYREDNPDAYVDELNATDGEVVVRSRRSGNQSNGRVVRYAPPGEKSYRTLVSTFVFGALKDKNGPNNKTEVMAKYLEFFGLAGPRVNQTENVAPASLGRIRALFR